MSDLERPRDLVAEEKERMSFVIVHHAYCHPKDANRSTLLVERIAAELYLPTELAVQLVAHLTYTGFLSWEGTGHPIEITPKGTEYIEKLAHRRRSLRIYTSDAPAP